MAMLLPGGRFPTATVIVLPVQGRPNRPPTSPRVGVPALPAQPVPNVA